MKSTKAFAPTVKGRGKREISLTLNKETSSRLGSLRDYSWALTGEIIAFGP